MDKNILNRQSQHWETNFSNKPEMFGLEPSLPAKKALNIFKENNYSKIVELGAGLGRDSIYFGKNSINVTALDYSENGIKVINEKIKKENLTSSISTLKFDIREDLPFETNSVDACYSHMLYCMALTQKDLDKLNNEIHRILKPGGLFFPSVHLLYDYLKPFSKLIKYIDKNHPNHFALKNMRKKFEELSFKCEVVSKYTIRHDQQGFSFYNIFKSKDKLRALKRYLSNFVLYTCYFVVKK